MILGTAAEVLRSDEPSRVIDALKKANGPMSVQTIMAVAELKNHGAADKLLFKMAESGGVKRVGRANAACLTGGKIG